jgi:hypothetical protein
MCKNVGWVEFHEPANSLDKNRARPKTDKDKCTYIGYASSPTIHSLAIRTTRHAPSLPTAATASYALSPGTRTAALTLRAGGAIAAAYTCCSKSRGGVLSSSITPPIYLYAVFLVCR